MILNKKFLCLILVGVFLYSSNVSAFNVTFGSSIFGSISLDDSYIDSMYFSSFEEGDIDPLVDLEVTVTIKEIRALDKIDSVGGADFYVIVFINDERFVSDVFSNQNYVDTPWSATLNVPDDVENVSVRIQLRDRGLGFDRFCDLSDNSGLLVGIFDVDLVYNLRVAHWVGDDYIYPDSSWSDPSGYGRLNGCDDNSIYDDDRDCLILFDISQNDFDGDGIPFWTEENIYKTDPMVDDTGRDDDGDGVPIEWEFRWGVMFDYDYHHDEWRFYFFYDPFVWEDHRNMDSDVDGLDNVEEYLTSEWGSDPFRKDIFVELDQMEAGPNGEPASLFPELSKDLLRDAFDRYNIFLHLDDGCMGGGEMIPFDIETPRDELVSVYEDYFLHGDSSYWRKGVFHYGLVVYDATYSGYMFWTEDDFRGAFQISKSRMDKKTFLPGDRGEAIAYASGYMHELGHTLGIFHSNSPGCDVIGSSSPWKIVWWKWRPYKSCMNYGYVFFLVDYSNGSCGRNDHDDWRTLDLTYFQKYIE